MNHHRRRFLRALGAGSIAVVASGTSTAQDAGAVVVEGGGSDIWNDADEFHYFFADVAGDFDAIVRVDSVEDTDEYAKAGLMVRGSLADDAANVMIRRTPEHTSVQWRPEAGADSTSLTSDAGEDESEIDGGTIDADWQRIVRSGETILAYASTDGSNWTLVAEIDAVDLPSGAYLGLAVTSHNSGTLCAAQFSNLGGFEPAHSQDVGDVDVAGSVSGEGVGTIDPDPLVATRTASDVTTTTATLHGSLDSLGGASSASVSFEYRESGSSSWQSTSGQTVTASGSFSEQATGLASATSYEFRAVAAASDGDTDTGAIVAFETARPDTDPMVETGQATSVSATSATLNGTLVDVGGQASSAEVSFEYREQGSADWSATSPQTLEEPGGFGGTVFGLSTSTDYEFRAVVEADDGDTAVGTTGSFTTDEGAGDEGLGSYFDLADGFATPAPWLTDDVDVYVITEPTRAALEEAFHASGPRVVVFETSGTIDLGDTLQITEDQCWVAGQTAPSPGITLVGGMLQVDANDCVVQHIRSRIGPGADGNIQGNDSINTQDETTNNVIDHCTASWGTDECMSVGYDTDRTTYSNNLIYEGLWDPYGDGSDHNYCTLIGDGATNVALLGNVWAKARNRIPRLKNDTSTVVANNFAYFFDEASNVDGSASASFVGNVYTGIMAPGESIVEGSGTVYGEDNVTADPPIDADVDFIEQSTTGSPPLWPSGLQAMPSSEVEAHNLRYAGARPADRTAQDLRIIEEIRTRAGNDRLDSPYDYWIPHPDAVGGYPDLPVNTHTLDVPDSGLRQWLEQWALAVEEPGVEPPSGGGTPSGIDLGAYTAQDPNGDGKYTDVNGNGGNDFDDVVSFFDEMNSDGVQNNVSAFDFNDNGGIDFDDVVALFERV